MQSGLLENDKPGFRHRTIWGMFDGSPERGAVVGSGQFLGGVMIEAGLDLQAMIGDRRRLRNRSGEV